MPAGGSVFSNVTANRLSVASELISLRPRCETFNTRSNLSTLETRSSGPVLAPTQS